MQLSAQRALHTRAYFELAKKQQLKLLLKTSFAPVINMYVFNLLAEK